MTQRKERVPLPPTYRPMFPRMYDVLKEAGVPRPYDLLADMFGVSVSLVQKVTADERKRAS